MANFTIGARKLLRDLAYGIFTPYRDEERMFDRKWGDLPPALQLKLGLVAYGPFVGEVETGDKQPNTCAVLQVYQMTNRNVAARLDANAPSGSYIPADIHLQFVGHAKNEFDRLHVFEVAPQHPGGRKYGLTVSSQTEALRIAARWQDGRFGEALDLAVPADPEATMFMPPSHATLSSSRTDLMPRRGLLPTLRRLKSRIGNEPGGGTLDP